MTPEESDTLMQERAERIEVRDGKRYAIVPVASLSADEFADVIMSEVRKLQNKKNEQGDL